MLDLYKNIKDRRKALGMTQTELAHKAGYSEKSSIARIESGSVNLPLSKIKEFAKALDTSAAELMGFNDDENESYSNGEMAADLLEKVNQLPPEGVKELETYLDFLLSKYSR